MKPLFFSAALAIGLSLAAFSPVAHAATIVGNMSFTKGGLVLLDSSLSATTIPSGNSLEALQFISAPSAGVSFFGTNGDYASVVNANVVFQASPYVFSGSPTLLWTAGAFEFYSQSAVALELGGTLRVYVSGFVRAPNFDDTPATWVLTTQGVNSTVAWTSSINTIPEPTVPLIAGVLSVVLLRRRRSA